MTDDKPDLDEAILKLAEDLRFGEWSNRGAALAIRSLLEQAREQDRAEIERLREGREEWKAVAREKVQHLDAQRERAEKAEADAERQANALSEIAKKGHTTERHSYGASWPICKCVACCAGSVLAAHEEKPGGSE